MGAFVVVYPKGFNKFSSDLINELSAEVNQILIDYRQVFQTEIQLPITLRIYPVQDDFYCLNPQAEFLGEGTAHSHVGMREIALFGNQLWIESDDWQPGVLNGIQHEIAVLFTSKISGDFIPPGLLNGIGGYAENPETTFRSRFEDGGSPEEVDYSWELLWEDNAPLSDLRALLQSTSTVAYMVDVYGWDQFVTFLTEIKLQQGYHQALTNVYGSGLQEIEKHWKIYYPIYLEHRWQVNFFHAYDLEVSRELLSAGAYQDAASRLEEAVFAIGIFGDAVDLAEAERLLDQARIGVEAKKITLQARNALFSANFETSYVAATKALDLYDQLGDTRRTVELQAYQAAAKEGLDLRAGLDVIRQQRIGINPFKSFEVLSIGHRLLALGDTESVDQVSILLAVLGIEGNAFGQFLISLVILICVGLIIRQAVSARKPAPPEADLL